MTNASIIYKDNLNAAEVSRLSAHINSMSAEIGAIATHPDYRHMTLDQTDRVKTFAYTYTITDNTINLIINRSSKYRTKNVAKIKAVRKEVAISTIRKQIETDLGHKMRLKWKTN